MKLLVAATLAAAVCTPTVAQTPTRWVLVYSGGPKRPAYTVDDLRHLLTVVDSADRSIGRLCDGVILTEYEATSGRYYMPWATGEHAIGADWDQYLDSLTAPSGILSRLDSAAAAQVGPVWFTVMVPYPDSVQKAFQYDGTTWDLTVPSNRADVVDRHVRRLASRVRALRLPHLEFAGFYWLNESARPADSIGGGRG